MAESILLAVILGIGIAGCSSEPKGPAGPVGDRMAMILHGEISK